jgi:hypothetical protein
MTNHPEARRHVFQLLGDVLAELLHRGTTLRADPGRLRQMGVRVARQMFRQRLALGPFRRSGWCLRDLDRSCTLVGLQILQTEFKLIDLAIELLGLAAELHAPQLCNQEVKVFDFRGARGKRCLLRVDCLLKVRDLRVAFIQPCITLAQHGLQSLDVVGKCVRAGHDGSLRAVGCVYNAELGRAVRVG